MNTPSPESLQAALTFLSHFFGQEPGATASATPVPQASPSPATPAVQPTSPRTPHTGLPQPAADLFATAENVVLVVAVPGLPGPEAVALRLLSPTELLLECWLQLPPGIVLLQELPTGWLARTFPLPAPVRPDSLVARYEAGLLTLTFARAGAQPSVQARRG
jgi:HSP20 family molecular chaperone IbpA